MLKLIPLLFLIGCSIPKAKTTTEIVQWSKCDIPSIAYWVGQHDYKVVKGWNTAEECIKMEAWDCKCSATIAKDTLNACGLEARIQILKHDKKVHAVTLFTDEQGHRGFIDGGKYGEFGHDDWADIIDHIGGGPWAIY